MADHFAGIRDGHALVRSGHLINEEIIDDFESGTIFGRYYETGAGDKFASSHDFRGEYGLEMDGFGELWSTPEHENDVNYYFQPGETVEYWVNPRRLASHQYWFILCPRSATSTTNRYQIEHIMTGTFRIRTDVSGSRSILVEDTAFTWEAAWHRVRATVDPADGLEVQIRRWDKNTGDLSTPLSNLKTADTTHIRDRNGIGFRCGDGGRVLFDEVTTKFEGIVYDTP